MFIFHLCGRVCSWLAVYFPQTITELFYLEKCREYVTFWDFGNNNLPLWKDALGSLLGAEVEALGLGVGLTFRWLTGSSREKSKGMFCCSDGRPERMEILE